MNTDYNKASRHYWWIIAAKVTLAVVLLYLVLRRLDLELLKMWLYSISPLGFIAAFVLMQLSVCASALRSRYYLSQSEVEVSMGFSVRLYYVGMLFNIILPGGIGGDAYKVYQLWKFYGLSKLKVIRLLFYERVNGVMLLGLIAAILLPFSSFWPWLVQWVPLPLPLYWILVVLIWPSYLFLGQAILRDKVRTMVGASGYSAWGQLMQVMMALVLTMSLERGIELLQLCNYLFLFAVSSVVAILPVSIGGAGLRELTFLIGLDLIAADNKELGIALAMMVFALQVLSSLLGVLFVHSIHAKPDR